jgi:hypothetical protein
MAEKPDRSGRRRSLADWRDELGLDRLIADLVDGDLDACWYDHGTGEFHEIPRLHWQPEHALNQVKRAIGWGWRIKRDDGGLFQWDHCKIYAARSAKHAGGRKPIYDWEAFAIEAARFVQTDLYIQTKPSKKRAVLTGHLCDWFDAHQDQSPGLTEIKKHVKKFLDANSVSDQKAPRKSKNT